MSQKWWEGSKVADFGLSQGPDAAWAVDTMFRQALEDGRTIYTWYQDRQLTSPKEELIEAVSKELRGRVILRREFTQQEQVYFNWDLVGEEATQGFGQLVFNSDGTVSGSAAFDNKAAVEKLKALYAKHTTKRSSSGRAYVLISTQRGPKLESIGVASHPLERGNYNPETVEGFDRAVEDYKSNDPKGRLVVLDGEPGTGKSHMVRSFMHAVPDALFVLIPANLVPNLGGPELVKALIEIRNNAGQAPAILIIEDADDCLGSRAQDNVNHVSALLNLGDGILGQMMDIRLLCTTNLKKEELDGAITRPGRLSEKISVGRLDAKVATAAYERITGKKLKIDEPITLAEVYALARDAGWKPAVRKRTMGFGPPPVEPQAWINGIPVSEAEFDEIMLGED